MTNLVLCQDLVRSSFKSVVTRWAGQDKVLLFPLFQLIASGDSLEEARLARSLNRDRSEIDAMLDTSLAEVDEHGRVAELFGITREPTLHRIDVSGTILYSCCALVAHMVPAIMQQAVVIESTDPISGSKLRLEISADSELRYVDHSEARGSMVDCAIEEIISSPRSKFCCYVKHFASSEAAAEFASKRSNRYVLTIEDFHNAAQWLYKRIWVT